MMILDPILSQETQIRFQLSLTGLNCLLEMSLKRITVLEFFDYAQGLAKNSASSVKPLYDLMRRDQVKKAKKRYSAEKDLLHQINVII